MDDTVGRVVEALKKVNQFENTIFVFSSDNGGQVMFGSDNSPYRGRKYSLHEGGVRSPAFVTGPGIPKAATYTKLFHIADWMPTLLDAVNVKRDGVLLYF